MLQYLGWHWPATDPLAAAHVSQQSMKLSEADQRWRPALKQAGLLVWVLCGRHDPPPTRLHDGAGTILGRLFQGATLAPRSLDERVTRRILESRGEALIRDYWGNYVAILNCHRGNDIILLRGPASTLPVLRDTDGTVQRFYSSVETPAALKPIPNRIDWPVFAGSLIAPVATARTALRAVTELLPGHAEDLTRSGAGTRDLWQPIDLARESPIASPTEAAREVRAAVETCTRAYAAGHEKILHALSGGLDSSVVLAALNGLPDRPSITCVTHYSEDVEGDERPAAHEALRGTRAQLIELRRVGEVNLARALGGMRTVRPPGLRMPEVDRSELELADELGASTLTKGFGGDELFARNLVMDAAADCLRHDAGRGFLELALHAAVTEGITFWQVLCQAASRAWLPHHRGYLRSLLDEHAATSLLSPEAIDLLLSDASLAEDPYLEPLRHWPGKHLQVTLATGPRPYGTPHSRPDDVTVCAPLLSQPVIEIALRIPIRLQFQNRGERAVLRNAFADVLSPGTLRKRTKGGAEMLARSILNRNVPRVRELLLDGLLSRERIVDRERLLATLTDQPAAGSIATAPVFNLLGAEIWLRRWLGG